MLKEERCVKSERMKQFLVKRPNHAQSYCYSGTRVTVFAITDPVVNDPVTGPLMRNVYSRPVLLLTPQITDHLRPDEKKRWEPNLSILPSLSAACLPISTITNNLLPFHFCLLPLLSSSSSGSWYYVLNSLQVGKIWPEVVKFVCGLYWLYFMIIYLSYNNACLRERKLTGRKCLKQKWLKKEEFLRRVGGSGFAENRARISF